jgi:hypothetical protein
MPRISILVFRVHERLIMNLQGFLGPPAFRIVRVGPSHFHLLADTCRLYVHCCHLGIRKSAGGVVGLSHLTVMELLIRLSLVRLQPSG